MELPRTVRVLVVPGLALAAGALLLKYCLPLLLPFLLGLAAAGILSPLIRRLRKRTGCRHASAAALCVTGMLLMLSGLLYLMGRLLLGRLSVLYSQLPELVSSISEAGGRISKQISSLAGSLPGSLGDALRDWSESLPEAGGDLLSTLYEKLFSGVSGFLRQLPDNLLFLLTTILSCYFSAAELPRILDILREHLPKPRWERFQELLRSIRTVLGGWLRAQLKLMGVTFLILLCGFVILRVRVPLLLALGVALLDALPLFGTGTVLLPWGFISLISGTPEKGVGLLILYAAAALSRNVLEPRFLGDQMGVSPLLTLFAIYLGYRLSGLSGMILLPMGLMVAAEVYTAGRRSRLWEHPGAPEIG